MIPKQQLTSFATPKASSSSHPNPARGENTSLHAFLGTAHRFFKKPLPQRAPSKLTCEAEKLSGTQPSPGQGPSTAPGSSRSPVPAGTRQEHARGRAARAAGRRARQRWDTRPAACGHRSPAGPVSLQIASLSPKPSQGAPTCPLPARGCSRTRPNVATLPRGHVGTRQATSPARGTGDGTRAPSRSAMAGRARVGRNNGGRRGACSWE